MSIVKDILFVLLLSGLGIYCLSLIRCVNKQRNYFVNIFKHDLKVSVLAQKRVLDMLSETKDEELLSETRDANDEILDLINSVVDTNEVKKCTNREFFSLSELVVLVFKSLSKSADKKELDFYYRIDDDLCLYADRVGFYRLVKYIILNIMHENFIKGRITCTARVRADGTYIKFFGGPVHNSPKVQFLGPLGNEIRKNFCLSYVKKNGWKIEENCKIGKMKTFTIFIPAFNRCNLFMTQ